MVRGHHHAARLGIRFSRWTVRSVAIEGIRNNIFRLHTPVSKLLPHAFDHGWRTGDVIDRSLQRAQITRDQTRYEKTPFAVPTTLRPPHLLNDGDERPFPNSWRFPMSSPKAFRPVRDFFSLKASSVSARASRHSCLRCVEGLPLFGLRILHRVYGEFSLPKIKMAEAVISCEIANNHIRAKLAQRSEGARDPSRETWRLWGRFSFALLARVATTQVVRREVPVDQEFGVV